MQGYVLRRYGHPGVMELREVPRPVARPGEVLVRVRAAGLNPIDHKTRADALADLSAEHRSVVVGAYYRGRSVAELAAELDVPAGTVKSRMHYALRALRLALQEKGVTP